MQTGVPQIHPDPVGRVPPLGSRPAPKTGQRYRITALCSAALGDRVQRLLRGMLRSSDVAVECIDVKHRRCGQWASVVAYVRCAPQGRAVLIRVVDRLGSEPAVRSVHWETALRPVAGAAAD